MFDWLNKWYYDNFIFNREKKYIFLYLESGIKKGFGISDLILALIDEYSKEKNDEWSKITLQKLIKLNEAIVYEGLSISDALYDCGFVNSREKSILTYAKSLDSGLHYITESEKKYNDIKWAILIFFIPSMVVSTGYLIFQPELKDLILEMIKPVNQYSTTPIEIPVEFRDRTIFWLLNIVVYGLCFLAFATVYILKIYFPKIYFRYLPLVDKEFILNYFTIISNQMDIGISLGQVINNILDNEKDPLAKKIFSEINNKLILGEKDYHEILHKYGFDKATISYMKIGEYTQSFSEALEIMLDYNRKRHEKQVKLLLRVLPLSGEIIMAFILLLPIIDMIMLTTTGVLNFTI